MAILSCGIAHAAGVSSSELELEIPSLGDPSCYTLTKITDESSITNEDFVITKYLGDVSTGNLTPIKYLLTFNNPLGDDPNVGSPAARYFKWAVDENGNRSLINTGPYDTAKDITAYSSNNVRLDTTPGWTPDNDVNNSFLYRGTSSVTLEGGAIYNAKYRGIKNIKGDFIANFVESAESSSDRTFGGAIYNAGGITRIYGNFISNYASSSDISAGGAIYNYEGTIQSIQGFFIGNNISYTTARFLDNGALVGNGGGAICNRDGTINSIMGDFIGNYIKHNASTPSDADYIGGGAIFNSSDGIIGDIDGDFIGNYFYFSNHYTGGTIHDTGGGAIYNCGKIGKIWGDFINNYSEVGGGAIQTRGGSISGIEGNFIANHSQHSGGAIYTSGNIGYIKGNFIGNYIDGDYSYGGALSTSGSIEYISGNFIGNYVYVTNSWGGRDKSVAASGGAIDILAKGTIESIKGDFTGNYIYGTASNNGIGNPAVSISGGAMDMSGSDATVGYIAGDFVDNYLHAYGYNRGSTCESYGGAISIVSAEVGNIVGDFIRNHAIADADSTSAYLTAQGGAMYLESNSSSIENIAGNFIGNYTSVSATVRGTKNSSGGAIYNFGIIGKVTGDFIGNYASASSAGDISGMGGAIYNAGVITLNNSMFNSNYTSVLSESQDEVSSSKGGAIYATNSTTVINVSEETKIRSHGNYAELNGFKDDANGGFLYMADSALVNFNTEKGSSYIIGDGRVGYDSIASDDTKNIINKNGKGEVVVNSSMEFYKGTLNVNEGNMIVNNKLGASRVSIANGASLSAKVNGDGTFTNSALNFSNDGTLNLVAGENLATGKYGTFVFENPETVYFGNVKSYGGTFDHATGTFIVGDANHIVIDETNPVSVEANGRVWAVGAESSNTSIVMNFNSADSVTVNSVFDTTESDEGFNEILNTMNPADILLAEAFEFDVDNLGFDDKASLSFRIGSGFDISQITIYHKDSEFGWEFADVANLEYDGEYLSFIVDGFSSYGYIAAVPEPSTYAAICGILVIAFAVWRRRN